MARLRSGGFTLIELMVVVTVIAVLAAIAYPSYRDYVLRGQLVDATNALASFRAEMERHFQDNRSYATVGSFVSPCQTSDTASRTVGNFVVSCTGALDANGYTLQAVGSGPTSGFTFTIDQNANRTTTAPSGWGNCTSGWALKRGQCS